MSELKNALESAAKYGVQIKIEGSVNECGGRSLPPIQHEGQYRFFMPSMGIDGFSLAELPSAIRRHVDSVLVRAYKKKLDKAASENDDA